MEKTCTVIESKNWATEKFTIIGQSIESIIEARNLIVDILVRARNTCKKRHRLSDKYARSKPRYIRNGSPYKRNSKEPVRTGDS